VLPGRARRLGNADETGYANVPTGDALSGDRRHWHRAGPHLLAREAPFDGTFRVAYQSHRAVSRGG
jgi:hypothetical protein